MYSLSEEIFFNANKEDFDRLIEILVKNHDHHLTVAMNSGGYIREGAMDNARKLVEKLTEFIDNNQK